MKGKALHTTKLVILNHRCTLDENTTAENQSCQFITHIGKAFTPTQLTMRQNSFLVWAIARILLYNYKIGNQD